ncbi:MAG: glycosyltransferase family 2 protein [Proteobacteria bacterium]|nr:MAG: glycosyltransferase family 2 protein [Pseudomonadota bacterium]
MTLSIIIVSYNVKLLLENCLHSITKAIEGIESEVIVIDNASPDNSIGYLQPIFPTFTFIANSGNEGFAKANNKALETSTGKFVLFLNPDTVVPADCFSKCIHFLESHASAGALGVKMLDGEGKFLKESKRGFPSPAVSLLKLSGIDSSKYYLDNLDNNKDHEVDILSGAFMMIKRGVLERTGGFDERFFMYAEDIDLSYRILKAGYKNYYFAGTTIVHYKGASTKKDVKYVRQFYKAMSQFTKKYYGRGAYSLFLDVGIAVFTLFSSLRVAFSSKTSRRVNGLLP